jgi:uncharacterized protein
VASTVQETIVITGASRGIGEATAMHLARPGRELLLLARSEDKLDQICKEISRSGANAHYLVADLSSIELATKAAREIADRVDDIDILILNAGMSNDKRFEETTTDELFYELGVNYLAPVTLLHHLLPQLRRSKGHVVVVGSLTAILPFPSNATYAASKAPLLSLIKSLRLEMKETGIHFGIVLPGLTETSATDGKRALIPKASPQEIAEAISKCIEERKGLLIPGAGNRIAAAIFQQFPELAEKVINPLKYHLVPGFGDHQSE